MLTISSHSFFEIPDTSTETWNNGLQVYGRYKKDGQSYERFVWGEGLSLSIGRNYDHLPLECQFELNGHLIIHCLMKGGWRQTVADNRVHQVQPLHCLVTRMDDSPPLIHNIPRQSMSAILFVCSPAALQNLMGLSDSDLSVSLGQLFSKTTSSKSTLLFGLDGVFSQLLAQVICANEEVAPLRSLFLRVKAIDLLYHVIRRIMEIDAGQTVPKLRLHPSEVERLTLVRHLLEERLSNPPTLDELRRATNLHTNKLSAGFKQLFGTTIHQYSLNVRLCEAKHLLKSGHSVAEVAEAVGYKEVTSLSRAFRMRYARKPTEMR